MLIPVKKIVENLDKYLPKERDQVISMVVSMHEFAAKVMSKLEKLGLMQEFLDEVAEKPSCQMFMLLSSLILDLAK